MGDDLELKCYFIGYVSLQVRISKLLNEAGTNGHEMFLVRRYMYSVAFKSLGHIPTRQKPGTGKQFPSLSARKIPRGYSVAEGSETVIHNAAHLYSDQANPLGDPAESHGDALFLHMVV